MVSILSKFIWKRTRIQTKNHKINLNTKKKWLKLKFKFAVYNCTSLIEINTLIYLAGLSNNCTWLLKRSINMLIIRLFKLEAFFIYSKYSSMVNNEYHSLKALLNLLSFWMACFYKANFFDRKVVKSTFSFVM
jgi:hypothetical protein